MARGEHELWPDLPHPSSNNAVAQLEIVERFLVFSLLGIGPKKTYDDITNRAFVLDPTAGRWETLQAVPSLGRLAATAQGVSGRVYLFGGYTVDGQGNEHTLPNVDIYDPNTGAWTRGADIPVPVDDAVSGVYRERYVYLVSGWSEHDNVPNVQVYDTLGNVWHQASPIAGQAVFGHSGAVLGNVIVYCDGVYRGGGGFNSSAECWEGVIDENELTRIHWRKLPGHPGAARYRLAAGAGPGRRMIFFSGGTGNPYNYNGIGYNGVPSEPLADVFAWDVSGEKWLVLNRTPHPSMDHRGLIVSPDSVVTLGGMEAGQQVSARVSGLLI